MTRSCSTVALVAVVLVAASTLAAQYVPPGQGRRYRYPNPYPVNPYQGRGTTQFLRDLYGRSGLYPRPRIGVVPGQTLASPPALTREWLQSLKPKTQGPPDVARWPSWVQLGGLGKTVDDANTLPRHLDPERCLLARLSDTVEIRPAGETAFFPISFWKKTRVIAPGAAVRIRSSGRALLMFSDGTRLSPMGATELEFVEADKSRLSIRFTKLTRLSAVFGTREVRVSLPEGSVLRGTGLDLEIDREVRNAAWAASGVEGRLWVRNWGPASLAVEADERESFELAQNRRSILALVRADPDGPAALEPLRWTMPGGGTPVSGSEAARAQMTGSRLTLRAAAGTARINWGGVELAVPAGKRVIVDPIAGDPFGDGRVTPIGRTAGDRRIPSDARK